MNKKRKELVISVIGVLLLILSAAFCYQTVRDAIISNEKESIQNIAEVSSHSLQATLQGKSNLVYAALSGDMANEESIEASLLKVGEKGIARLGSRFLRRGRKKSRTRYCRTNKENI